MVDRGVFRRGCKGLSQWALFSLLCGQMDWMVNRVSCINVFKNPGHICLVFNCLILYAERKKKCCQTTVFSWCSSSLRSSTGCLTSSSVRPYRVEKEKAQAAEQAKVSLNTNSLFNLLFIYIPGSKVLFSVFSHGIHSSSRSRSVWNRNKEWPLPPSHPRGPPSHQRPPLKSSWAPCPARSPLAPKWYWPPRWVAPLSRSSRIRTSIRRSPPGSSRVSPVKVR